jgi:hypothetical protein
MHSVRIGARLARAVLLVVVAVSVAGFVAGSVASAAYVQDEEGDGDAGAASEVEAQGGVLRVRIDAGACDTPDANTPVVDLTDAASVGGSAAGEVYTSETEIPVPLADLLGQPHALSIELDDAEFAIPIACAAVEGTVAGGKLVVGLLAADSGELTGIAVLRETNGGTTTLVETYVILTSDTGEVVDGEDGDDEEDTVDGEGGV